MARCNGRAVCRTGATPGIQRRSFSHRESKQHIKHTLCVLVIDIDRCNPHRPDHVGKTDGLKKWDELFPDLDYTNSLIVVTPSGGRHLYCEYDETITNKDIAKDVLIDILSDGMAVTFGPKYKILRSPIGNVPPIYQDVKMYLTMNNCQINNVTNNYVQWPNAVREGKLSELWDIDELEGDCFKLVTKLNICCVNNEHKHSEPKHSKTHGVCFIVRKKNERDSKLF